MNNDERLALIQDVKNGSEAEVLLGNNLLQSIIFSGKNAAFETFANSTRGEDKKRADAWFECQSYISLENNLQQLVERGKIAQNLLDEADRFNLPNNNPTG